MVSRFFTSMAGWGLVLMVIYAPWAYGCTRPEGIFVLNCLSFTSGTLWLAGTLLELRLPKCPPLLLGLCLLILLLGWSMTWNAQGMFDRQYGQFAVLEQAWEGGPGSIDAALSFRFMLTISGLLLVCLAASDLGRQPALRQKLLAAMVISGLSFTLFAFFIKLSGSRILYWPYGRSQFMFGTYRYHANAGAYLNLIWPLASSLAILSLMRESSRLTKGLMIGSSFALYVGVAINASKGSQIVAALLAILFFGCLFFWRKRLFPGLRLKAVLFLASTLLVGIIALTTFTGLKYAEKRWENLSAENADSDRLKTYHTTLQMLPESGVWGFGPGTFQTKFPSYNAIAKQKVRFFWEYTHEDYLQTLVEWGYVGAGLWLFLVVGGFVRLSNCFRSQIQSGSLRSVISLGILTSLAGVFLHALVDFPLQVPSLQLYTLLLLGFAWCSPSWAERRRRSSEAASEEA